MSLNIEEFKGALLSGIARPNKFRVQLPGNIVGTSQRQGTIAALNGGMRDINILCKSCTLPMRQMLTAPRQIGMKSEEVTHGYAVQDVTFSFHEPNTYLIRNYFQAWMDKQVDLFTHELEFKKGSRGEGGYAKDVGIFQLNNAGQDIYRCVLIDAFPKTLGQIDLSNDNNGTVETTVTMTYTNWRASPIALSNLTPVKRTRPPVKPQTATAWINPDIAAAKARKKFPNVQPFTSGSVW
tara:strand:+ start:1446 stop:2159 length:714 start_codon:yes stop_codon:yes gene_type:complete